MAEVNSGKVRMSEMSAAEARAAYPRNPVFVATLTEFGASFVPDDAEYAA
jgi:hypothetical protein